MGYPLEKYWANLGSLEKAGPWEETTFYYYYHECKMCKFRKPIYSTGLVTTDNGFELSVRGNIPRG